MANIVVFCTLAHYYYYFLYFLAFHQSGHNSGVIHAGIYYQPGSLKAKLCVEGLHLSYKYLDEKDIPYKRCGKLVVATNKDEIGRLEQLHKRALQNCVPGIEMVDEKKIKEIEPFCKVLLSRLYLTYIHKIEVFG